MSLGTSTFEQFTLPNPAFEGSCANSRAAPQLHIRSHYHPAKMEEQMRCIAYNDGYGYQLKKTYTLVIGIRPSSPIDTKYIDLDVNGNLTIHEGYAWDGPSGPAIDSLTFMRGSLVHDALYQLMREKFLDPTVHREAANRILQQICKEDGMWSLRAWWVYQGVRLFADLAADPASTRPVTRAPKGCQP
jgi:hypothetical protein